MADDQDGDPCRSGPIQARGLIAYSVRQIVKLLVVLLAAAVIPTAGMAQGRGGFGFRHGGFAKFHRPWPAQGPPRGAWTEPPPGAFPAPGPWRVQQDAVRMGVRGGRMAPLGYVISNLQRRTPGRQLDTTVEFEDGRPVYRVRWITNQGRRIDYVVDAATGRYLGER